MGLNHFTTVIRGEGGSAKKRFSMIKGAGVQTPPKKHDIINEQPLKKIFYYLKLNLNVE